MGPDEPGEILIRGDQVSGKYVGTESKVDADGWLHTGDRGWLDIEGYLFCEGRADDTIIRGGENIGPAEVEDALLQHDAISVAAVVGLADEQYGEKIAAMISLRAGVEEIDIDHVREWVRTRIGSLKTPEIIVVVEEVPQTATGKILRRQVKDDLGGLHRPLTLSARARRPPAARPPSSPRRRAARRAPFSVPSRNATVTERDQLERRIARLRVRRHVARVQASPSSAAR